MASTISRPFPSSNLKSIIYNSRESNFPINVSLVLSNNNKAQGINHARKFAIPFKILDGNIDKFENNALKEISDRNIKLICLAGFMRILSKNFMNLNETKRNLNPEIKNELKKSKLDVLTNENDFLVKNLKKAG